MQIVRPGGASPATHGREIVFPGCLAPPSEKIQIERDKLALEKTKLDREETRAKWTAFGVGVPLLVGVVTVGFGLLSTKEQARAQLRLEIAKAIMSAPTIAETFDRARLLTKLFPADVADLVKGANEKRDDAFVTPAQRELFRAMVARDMKPRQILDLYIALFPGEKEWTSNKDIRKATDPLPQSN